MRPLPSLPGMSATVPTPAPTDPTPGDRPTVAIDIDDTLNDFSHTLRTLPIPYDPTYALSEPTFAAFLARVREDAPESGDLLSTEYSYFRYRIHELCYRAAAPRSDGVDFVRWLREEGWRIVICTRRDLRRAQACTRAWLEAHVVPFDHLFMAANKIAFCRAWGIPHLVDDDPFQIEHGGAHGVQVYYPVMAKHAALPPHTARGFSSFEEVKSWIRASAS